MLIKRDLVNLDVIFYKGPSQEKLAWIEEYFETVKKFLVPETEFLVMRGAIFVTCPHKDEDLMVSHIENVLENVEVECEIQSRRIRKIVNDASS